MLKVVGIVHSRGNYNGADYDNYNLHCIRPAIPSNENEDGDITEIVKVKASVFDTLHISVGDTIDVFYDKYGRIRDVHIS